MKLQSKLKLLAIPAIIINLMPTSMATAQANLPRGFTQTCTDLFYSAGQLSAKCRTINGGYRTSSIDLNRYIASSNGNLVWSREGNFASTFSNCQPPTSPQAYVASQTRSYLTCSARTTDGRDFTSTIVLDEHIENIDGQLQYYK